VNQFDYFSYKLFLLSILILFMCIMCLHEKVTLALYGLGFVTFFICVLRTFCFLLFSFVNRKSSDLGLEGLTREFIQTDCAINQVDFFSSCQFTNQIQTRLSQ
jgi:hypothetical protein